MRGASCEMRAARCDMRDGHMQNDSFFMVQIFLKSIKMSRVGVLTLLSVVTPRIGSWCCGGIRPPGSVAFVQAYQVLRAMCDDVLSRRTPDVCVHVLRVGGRTSLSTPNQAMNSSDMERDERNEYIRQDMMR